MAGNFLVWGGQNPKTQWSSSPKGVEDVVGSLDEEDEVKGGSGGGDSSNW